ncbi:MAG: molybdate ABC transporter substrate-binding protein [Firmicutes bacterium]|nr:molybdate ABC transporter substrate-binding protein [Bacillota bacterium]
MKNAKKIVVIALAMIMALCTFTACGSDEPADLSDQTLQVFSGAGLAEPVQEIADTFKEQTGCEVEIVFGPTGQLITQIQTSESGDLLIAGAVDEIAAMDEEEITATHEMVKHIPVLIVQAGNPKNVASIKDLAELEVMLADPEVTPIGKIAVKVFENAGIMDTIDVVANTTTAPLALTAVAEGNADATIVWKENASKNDKVEIVDLEEMAKYIKVVPAVELSYSTNEDARIAFVEFMTGEEGMAIWAKYGYEAVE